jgi:hypothetical protein
VNYFASTHSKKWRCCFCGSLNAKVSQAICPALDSFFRKFIMIHSHSIQTFVLMGIAALLTACAITPTSPSPTASDVVGGMQSADAKSQECVTASLVGGLLGGMMAEGTNTAKGAAAGAGIGMLGCVALKANARQAQAKSNSASTPNTPVPAPVTP